MKNTKTLHIFSLVALIAMVLAIFCLVDFGIWNTNENYRFVTDMSGKEVAIPPEVSGVVITCCGGAANEFAVLGAEELVIGQPEKCISDSLLEIVPEYRDTKDAGSFNNVNVEEIITLNPDIVIASVTSTDGNDRISDAGIPVVTILTGKATLEKLPDEFTMIGEITEKEEETSKLLSYWHDTLDMVGERVAGIPENERKRVYYMLGNTLHTNGGDWWGQEYISAAGGRNVAENISLTRDINMEDLYNWDPDVIIISSNEGVYITREEVKENPALTNLKAVKNDELYECPIGTFWWDRPSPETPLGILWLAKTLYPGKFVDIDIEDETRIFYKEFYDHNLTDDDIEQILFPKKCLSCK